ncbi:hypothetical protein GTP58_00325 [Duganella sp. CY15W]|uniref:hypothetical protein n=1 Tax=Duganella sp. CY15W TaxID=2692172 RepID=UPI0013700CA6|nr:hypothetical protein [Duganella sp. CY15W]MYM26762.1 hypothetical protein [Duganella sp. CY15W]
MLHPHILQKNMVEITNTTRELLTGLFSEEAEDEEDVETRFRQGRGMLMLWSELCFDMGATQLINIDAQTELEALLKQFTDADRARFNMPPLET